MTRNSVKNNNRSSSPSTIDDFLGADAQALIKCNQKLKELGIEKTINLPQICAIGDQSTGKSSLIEAISKIQVPKANELCTHCPIAINLSSGPSADSPWTCTVSIEERYAYNPSRKPNKKSPLGPWEPRDLKIVPLDTTTDKNRVPDLIAVAKVIVLDPNCDPTLYLRNPQLCQNAVQSVQFSPNIIKLDITEGLRPNLSFVDLPGVIANTARLEDRYLVDLVRALVTNYASDPNSVNMLAMPMSTDVANSKACGLVQDVKAQNRTLAVFTKVDTVDKEVQSRYIDRFIHNTDPLGFEHGYHFVVMDDKAINDEVARAREQAFFLQDPWHELDDSAKTQVCVNALSDKLRELLFQKTAEALPSNLKAIDARRLEIDAHLESLPEPPNEAQLPWKLQEDLNMLAIGLEKLFANDGSHAATIRKTWNRKAEDFRDSVINARPKVILQTLAETERMKKAEAKIVRMQARRGHAANDAVDVGSSDDETNLVSVKREKSCLQTKMHQSSDPVHRFRLEEIRDINAEHYSALVPGEIELRAVERMEILSVRGWRILLDAFLNESSILLSEQVFKCFNACFGQHEHLELFKVCEGFVKKYLEALVKTEAARAADLCHREQLRPFTLDGKLLQAKCQNFLAQRRKMREEFRTKLLRAETDVEEGAVKKNRDVSALLWPDPYEAELKMSATTCAYYEIAASRFTDVVCQGIFVHLLPCCGQELVEKMAEYLGVRDPTRHSQIYLWMSEDRERTARRQQLLHERNQLIEGHKYIAGVLGRGERHKPMDSPTKRRLGMEADAGSYQNSPKKKVKEQPSSVSAPFTPQHVIRQRSRTASPTSARILANGINSMTPTPFYDREISRLRIQDQDGGDYEDTADIEMNGFI